MLFNPEVKKEFLPHKTFLNLQKKTHLACLYSQRHLLPNYYSLQARTIIPSGNANRIPLWIQIFRWNNGKNLLFFLVLIAKKVS